MRHRKKLKKIGLARPHRVSVLKNLAASLVLHGRLRTTKRRAKALASHINHLLHIVQKKEPREAIRLLPRYLWGKSAAEKIMKEWKPKLGERKSGFTRITPIGLRKGDSAKLVQIEIL